MRFGLAVFSPTVVEAKWRRADARHAILCHGYASGASWFTAHTRPSHYEKQMDTQVEHLPPRLGT